MRKKSITTISDPLTTSPLIRRTRQSTNLESFKAYRSCKFYYLNKVHLVVIDIIIYLNYWLCFCIYYLIFRCLITNSICNHPV